MIRIEIQYSNTSAEMYRPMEDSLYSRLDLPLKTLFRVIQVKTRLILSQKYFKTLEYFGNKTVIINVKIIEIVK